MSSIPLSVERSRAYGCRMTGPWFSLPFGIALAVFAVIQLGPNPQWWSIITTIILGAAATISISRGVLDIWAARRRRTHDR